MSRRLPINTFSVGFNEAKYSETDYARQVATHFKTNHHELIVAPEDIIDRLPEAIGFRDAPVAETADAPIWMLSQEAAKSVKMVLSGGSDEIQPATRKQIRTLCRDVPAAGAGIIA
jgi:asparagine synthase (glutamine-hydrolysing)